MEPQPKSFYPNLKNQILEVYFLQYKDLKLKELSCQSKTLRLITSMRKKTILIGKKVNPLRTLITKVTLRKRSMSKRTLFSVLKMN